MNDVFFIAIAGLISMHHVVPTPSFSPNAWFLLPMFTCFGMIPMVTVILVLSDSHGIDLGALCNVLRTFVLAVAVTMTVVPAM